MARCAHAPPSVQSAVQSACTQHRAHTASLPAHTAKYTAYSTMCTHTLRRSPHPTTIACLTPHHAVSRTPPAARSEKLQRAPLPTPAVSLHSENFSIHPAAAPPRAHPHRSNEDVSRSMGYRPSPRLPHTFPFLFTAISIKRKNTMAKIV